jgi:hypothetical protein
MSLPLTDSEIAGMESYANSCTLDGAVRPYFAAAQFSRLLQAAREANRLRVTVEILGKLIYDEIGPSRLLELGWKVDRDGRP